MISAQQLANALYGTWHVIKFDIKGWGYFETSLQGFRASFTPALLLAPFHFLHTVTAFSPERTELDFIPYIVVEILSYVISWTLFPFAMVYVSEFLGKAPRYFSHMVPYNWIRLPIEGPLYLILLLFDFGAISIEGVAFLNLIGLGALIIYGTFVAGFGLTVTTGTAMGLVALDFVLGLTATLINAKV